ncbi:MAG: histidine-type phosphatase [Pseudomonadota bacterium]
MQSKLPPFILCSLALALAGCGGSDPAPAAAVPPTPAPVDNTPYYQTKTSYLPQQDAATYEAPPAGYTAVFTELVARHGSRGLSGVKYDAAMYNIWQKAAADGALTALGAQLGPDILKIMKANALLGYGVDGIGTPGYGNLSQAGINEHKQLAVRMRTRMAALFDQVAANAAAAPRQIVLVSSGVDRAKDSAANFSKSLVAAAPALASLVTLPPAPAPYPAGAPVTQPAGTDRFTLYFHALKEATDKVVDPADPRYQTYQDSQAYQAYLLSADYQAKIAAIATDANAKVVARTLLERLFTKAFVDKIDNGTYKFANTGSYSFISDDGKFNPTVSGDGKTTVTSLVDAASMLYNLYVITPGMKNELNFDFTQYMPSAQAKYLAYLQDREDFYKQGPSFTESNGVTYKMAQGLEDDFFKEVDAIEKGQLTHAAKLRFTHAEIIIPFASKMGLKNVIVPLPKAENYSYDNSVWRGEYVAPMASNMQWDVFRNSAGKVLVKMLYNEKETDFKAACDGAKVTATSHYYDYTKLKACYQHVTAP